METIRNQTYTRLEVMISIEPSEDADQTQSALERHQATYPRLVRGP